MSDRILTTVPNQTAAARPLATGQASQQSAEEALTRPHPNCYWVIPGRFLAGEYPGAFRPVIARQRLADYLATGVTFFLDLTQPHDGLEPYAELLATEGARLGIQTYYARMPIYDMSVPTPAQMITILDTVDQALAAGHNVYVHCWGGIGRTGTVVGCHLVRHGFTGDGALARIAFWWQSVEKSNRCPQSPETNEQVTFVRDWRE